MLKVFLPVTLILAFLVLGLWQFDTYVSDRDTLAKVRQEQVQEIIKAKKQQSLQSRFDRDLMALRSKVHDLRLLIPEALFVDSFIDDLAQLAARQNVRIGDHSYNVLNTEDLEEAKISLSLVGTKENVQYLTIHDGPLRRLVAWGPIQVDGSFFKLTATIFALPADNTYRDVGSCDRETIRGKPWLFLRSLRAMRKEIEAGCRELEQYRTILELDADYETQTRQVEILIKYIVEIKRRDPAARGQ